MKAGLLLAMRTIFQQQQGRVEKYLLGVRHEYAMLVVFARVAVIPVERGNLFEIKHLCIFL